MTGHSTHRRDVRRARMDRASLTELKERRSRQISPWEYPDCPRCWRHIYVDLHQHTDYICYKCDYRFDHADVLLAEAQKESTNAQPALSD